MLRLGDGCDVTRRTVARDPSRVVAIGLSKRSVRRRSPDGILQSARRSVMRARTSPDRRSDDPAARFVDAGRPHSRPARRSASSRGDIGFWRHQLLPLFRGRYARRAVSVRCEGDRDAHRPRRAHRVLLAWLPAWHHGRAALRFPRAWSVGAVGREALQSSQAPPRSVCQDDSFLRSSTPAARRRRSRCHRRSSIALAHHPRHRSSSFIARSAIAMPDRSLVLLSRTVENK